MFSVYFLKKLPPLPGSSPVNFVRNAEGATSENSPDDEARRDEQQIYIPPDPFIADNPYSYNDKASKPKDFSFGDESTSEMSQEHITLNVYGMPEKDNVYPNSSDPKNDAPYGAPIQPKSANPYESVIVDDVNYHSII